MSAPRSLIAIAALAAFAGACGVVDGDNTDAESLPPVTPAPTISGVGQLPEAISVSRRPIVQVSRPVNDDGTTAELIGETSEGNRILLIGDSILASTASRYGGNVCNELVPLGWETQVEAEPSRFIEFGNKVLDAVLDPDPQPGDDVWDAALVFLGNNYRGDPDEYEAELRLMLERLAPRPTLLLTVSEFRRDWVEVNEVVAELGTEYDNVTIIDWEEIAQAPGVLSGDGQHLTNAGRQVLAEVIAVALGPGDLGEGVCLRSEFTDDSAVNGGLGGSRGGSSSGSGSGGSTTPRNTTPNPVSTTTPPVVSTSPPSTDPPSTNPPATDPPVTDPPATDPPVTDPPPTNPPPTDPPPPTNPPPTDPPPPGTDP